VTTVIDWRALRTFRASCNSHLICCVQCAALGLLTAVDMNEARFRWQVPLGSMQDSRAHAQQIPPGSISLGGPIVTAGGIVFIAGTTDYSCAASTSKPARNCGRRTSSGSQRHTNDLSSGKQWEAVPSGRRGRPSENYRRKIGRALVAFTAAVSRQAESM